MLLFWLAAAVASRGIAPSWDQIAYDGDFEHLPDSMPSVQGTQLLDEAFPVDRPRSQFMIVISRDDGKLTEADIHVGYDLARRLRHRMGEVYFRRAMEVGWSGTTPPVNAKARKLVDEALEAFNQSIESDTEFYNYFADSVAPGTDPLREPRMALAYWDRARLHESLGNPDEAASDQEIALALSPEIDQVPAIEDRTPEPMDAMLDILSWDDAVIGKRLSKRGTRLVVLRLSSEFLATGNIHLLASIDEMLSSVRRYSFPLTDRGLKLEIAGSAAIGGETLTAARNAIQYTEWFTVILIMIILATVYRAPLLVAVPLISIGVAVACATGLISALASMGQEPGMEWLDLKVFTTSKIFVVVILFGAGTDYCLFLIARLREEAAYRPWEEAVPEALSKVMGALMGSALTTVVGLWMMWVAEFGKFHYIGPIIAICLLVGLAVCTSLTPAMLYALGPKVFWPSQPKRSKYNSPFWRFVSLAVTHSPRVTLVAGIALLLGPAIYGYYHQNDVSYDITTQLNSASRSRQGVKTLSRSFPLGESNPITVLIVSRKRVNPEVSTTQMRRLVTSLYDVEGVDGVRYFEDPLGENQPGKRRSVFDYGSLLSWTLKQHRISQNYFTSEEPSFKNRLVRFDVITHREPFGDEAAGTLSRVTKHLEQLAGQFSLKIETSEDVGLEETDLAVENVRYILNVLDREQDTSIGSGGDSKFNLISTIESKVGGTGGAWFAESEPELDDHTGEIVVTLKDSQRLVPFAKQLMELLREGDPQLKVDPLEGAQVTMLPSPIADSQVEFTGTTVAIQDLKNVTTRDTSRIKVCVVIAVLVILFFVLWRIRLSIYLIATVLLSYFATLGITVAFFRIVYGESFVGLDWKLPLFLFVILVAVGQDYNVYLVTRVLEEQGNGGRLAGLRRAIVRTGGIITSCGVVMAGTFFTMTAPAWAPGLLEWIGFVSPRENPIIVLRGVVELGFALGLGVLVDTFYVRTILVPAYVAAFDQRVKR